MSLPPIKVTASIDDKLSGQIGTIERNLGKFALSADGIFTKLARSFSATDIAVGLIIGSVVKLQQTIDKTAKAYLAQADAMDPVIKKYRELQSAIDANDKQVGALTSTWALFWKQQEKRGSDFLSTLAAIQALVPFVPGFGVSMREPGKFKGSGSGSSGASGADSGYHGPFADYFTQNEAERAFRDRQESESAREARTRRQFEVPVYPWEQSAQANRERITMRPAPGMDKQWDTREPDVYANYDPLIAAEEERVRMAKEATDRISSAFSGMFGSIIEGSQSVGDAIRQTFADLVKDLIAQMAGRAAARGLVSLIPGLGPLLSIASESGAVAVGPAAQNAGLRAMSYRGQRGV